MKTFQAQFDARDFSNALVTLKKNAKAFPEKVWHFNMGVVHGELNDWPLARYHFLMAEKDGFRSSELGKNLALAESKLDVKKLEKPLEVKDYLIQGSLFASEGIFAFLSLCLIVATLVKLRKKPNYKTAGLMLVLGAAPMFLDAWVDRWEKSVVLTPTPIYDAPTSIFGTRGELPGGVFVITEHRDGWEKVIYPSRFEGWVKPEVLKRLEE